MSWFLAVPNNGWIIRSIGSPHEIPTEWTVHSAGWHGARPLRIYTCTIRSRGCHLSWAEHAYINLYNLIHYVSNDISICNCMSYGILRYYIYIYTHMHAYHTHIYIYIYMYIKGRDGFEVVKKAGRGKKGPPFRQENVLPIRGMMIPNNVGTPSWMKR